MNIIGKKNGIQKGYMSVPQSSRDYVLELELKGAYSQDHALRLLHVVDVLWVESQLI